MKLCAKNIWWISEITFLHWKYFYYIMTKKSIFAFYLYLYPISSTLKPAKLFRPSLLYYLFCFASFSVRKHIVLTGQIKLNEVDHLCFQRSDHFRTHELTLILLQYWLQRSSTFDGWPSQTSLSTKSVVKYLSFWLLDSMEREVQENINHSMILKLTKISFYCSNYGLADNLW